MNGVHALCDGTLEIEVPIVDENTLLGAPLSDLKRQLINGLVGLLDTQKTRREKSCEVTPQFESIDTRLVEFP